MKSLPTEYYAQLFCAFARSSLEGSRWSESIFISYVKSMTIEQIDIGMDAVDADPKVTTSVRQRCKSILSSHRK